jgi:hypothetical protein
MSQSNFRTMNNAKITDRLKLIVATKIEDRNDFITNSLLRTENQTFNVKPLDKSPIPPVL